MKLNNRSRIAVDALLDVAVYGARVPVALASIGERLDVSLSYLEQLFRRLRARGFVKSSRGPGGGYQLNKRLAAISIADIVTTVDQETNGGRGRAGKRQSAIDEMWAGLDRHLLDYLRTVTLEAVLRQSGHVERIAKRPHSRTAAAPNRREEQRVPAAA